MPVAVSNPVILRVPLADVIDVGPENTPPVNTSTPFITKRDIPLGAASVIVFACDIACVSLHSGALQFVRIFRYLVSYRITALCSYT